jgi:hypothetical protein
VSALAQTPRDPMPEQYEQAIPREVAETVVDQLETVAVDEQQREAVRCALSAACNGLLEPMQEQGAVRQPGQWIMKCLMDQPFLRALASGDVDDHAFVMNDPSVVVPYRARILRDP